LIGLIDSFIRVLLLYLNVGDFKGKISELLEEALCTRHGGKHAGDEIVKGAADAIKSLAKPLRKDVGPKPTKAEGDKKRRAYEKRLADYKCAKAAYDSVRLELDVLSTTRGYHYLKKAWKDCIFRSNGDPTLACGLIRNLKSHLAGMHL
jgi:hypothetical protein